MVRIRLVEGVTEGVGVEQTALLVTVHAATNVCIAEQTVHAVQEAALLVVLKVEPAIQDVQILFAAMTHGDET